MTPRQPASAHLPVVLCDWDGTLRRGFTIIDWVCYLSSIGAVPRHFADIAKGDLRRYQSGELTYLEFARQAVDSFGSAMAGSRRTELVTLARSFVQQDRQLLPFTEDLLRQVSEVARLVVVSGAPEEILRSHLDRYERTSVFGLTLEFSKGFATGRIKRNPALTSTKRQIASMVLQNGAAVAAIGDSEADMPLLEAADLKIVVGSSLPSLVGAHVIRIEDDENIATSGSRAVDRIMEKLRGIG